MNSKKIIISLSVAIVLFLSTIPIAPIGPSCAKGTPSACGFVSNVILVVGGTVVLISELKNLVMPGTKVMVELDSGEIKKGTLTSKATSGRPIKSGEKIRLNCLKSSQLPNSKDIYCSLDFFGFDPNSSCQIGSPCYGVIPSWSISVDSSGVPDSNLLRFD